MTAEGNGDVDREPESPDATDDGAATSGAATSSPPARRRVVLTGVSSRAWEHPADRGALVALRELRGFDEVLKAISGLWNERVIRMAFLGGAVRVDHRQRPDLYRIFAEAGASLDVQELPELYVRLDPQPNAMCIGMAQPFIVLNSSMVDMLDEDELRFVLGHELGHMLSGHAVYRTMMIILTQLANSLAWLPLGGLALRAIILALLEWWRKAELSADRAGLLAGQDPAAALRTEMKLAGGGDLSDTDVAAFLEQGAEYDRTDDIRDSVAKLLLTIFRTHPVPVARATELRRWIDSGEYARILGGDYPRREDDRNASVSEEVKAAAQSYKESFNSSEDRLVTILRKFGEGTSGVGEWVSSSAGKVRTWMSGDQSRGDDSEGGDRSDKS